MLGCRTHPSRWVLESGPADPNDPYQRPAESPTQVATVSPSGATTPRGIAFGGDAATPPAPAPPVPDGAAASTDPGPGAAQPLPASQVTPPAAPAASQETQYGNRSGCPGGVCPTQPRRFLLRRW
jgi:hypothetical protein